VHFKKRKAEAMMGIEEGWLAGVKRMGGRGRGKP